MMPTLRRLMLDPGVLFSFANIFAFFQSDDAAALWIAVFTSIFSVYVSYARLTQGGIHERIMERLAGLPEWIVGDPGHPALRLTAYGVLASGVLALFSGAILPGLAGLAFAAGNFLASSLWARKWQEDAAIEGWVKALTHAAVYYGLGYAMIGLMAGGGEALLARPLGNIPALLTACLGVGATSLSSVGLVCGKFRNPAVPFMTVAFGTAINVLSGLLSGNLLGAANNFFAMCGETRLGQLHFDARLDAQPRAAHGFDRFFAWMSRQLLRPLYFLNSLS